MRTLVTLICIICAAILLVSPRDGFAWPTYDGGCQPCHGTGYPALNNHTIHQGQACNICHTSAGGGDKPISTSKCIACHPRSPAPGQCNLVNFHDPGKGSSCLTCHATECAPATTTTTATGTTTTAPATTSVPATTTTPDGTTTTPSETTTTTTPQDGCFINGPGLSCQTCHAATFTFGTPWHTSHQGYVGINCERCHAGGFSALIPTRVCTACHNESATSAVSLPCDWVELNPTHKAVCVSCHAACNEPPSPPPGPCPAETVLGMDDPRLDNLRAFRDRVLAKNPEGQKMIRMYYDSSVAVVKMLEKKPGLKQAARQYLDVILPAIEQMTKQKAAAQ